VRVTVRARAHVVAGFRTFGGEKLCYLGMLGLLTNEEMKAR
jgi:hypothetical protein